ncbi:MAG TPA: cbb3-type cytochrome c oxidase subunit 3 [Thermodesulfobacteriota bacterium]|nr:cbb3-type cytochrome c oxidase subunit 3 [Thermodesulfobacteriota bacterium]
MEELLILTKSFTTVYFFLIFCGILFWTLRGKNKEKLEGHKNIPFQED